MSSKYRLSLFAVIMVFFSSGKAIDEKASHLRGDPVGIALLRRNGGESMLHESYSRELVCRVDMIGLRGEYHYTANPADAQTVCATYLLAESNDLVEIEFTQFDVDCDDQSNQIQFFDGWSMGVGSFPGDYDHPLPLAERVINVCSQRRRVFRSHQNGAMITFKLGSPTASFRIAFRPVRNPEPCNVIAPEQTGAHTLRNYGNERNCSFSIIYPSTVNILEMSVGGHQTGDARLRCHEGLDYVELMEGNSLDMNGMRQEESMCGHVGNIVRETDDSTPLSGNNRITPGPGCETGAISVPLMCHNSVVRLVSSGHHVNHVSFQFNRLSIARSECPDDI